MDLGHLSWGKLDELHHAPLAGKIRSRRPILIQFDAARVIGVAGDT